jgi:hypothetical protein
VAGGSSESLSAQPGTGAYGSKSDAAASAIPGVLSGGPSPAASVAYAPSAAATIGPQTPPLPASPRPAASSAPADSASSPAAPPDLSLGAPSQPPATDQLPPDNVPGAKIVDTSVPPAGPSPLLVASIALLVVGIVLLLLRWVARRPA